MSAAAFYFRAKVVRVIDGDTALVDPQIYKQDEFLRVRFKDVFAPERGEGGYEEAANQAREVFPEGSEFELTNTRVRWTHARLEAVVTRA